MTSSSESLRRRVEAVLDMAVSTVSSLSEAFTAGVSLQVEEPAPGTEGSKEKSGTPSLPSIPEDSKEGLQDTSVNGSSKPAAEKEGTNGAVTENGAEVKEEDADEEDEGEDEDAILQVHD